MGIALCCVWAAYTTTELLEVAKSTVMSPEVAVHAAEPPEAAVLASAPCVVVAPSNSCPACHKTVEGTVDEHCTCPVKELYLFPDVTTVKTPEVAASAAEPSELSVVTIYESLSCSVTAMEAVNESLSCPVLSRLWRPYMNPRPVLSRLWRPYMNPRPVLSRLWMLSVNFLTVLLWLQGPSWNSHSCLSCPRKP